MDFSDNKTLLYILIGVVAFYIVIMPALEKGNKTDVKKIKEKLENVSQRKLVKVDKLRCSKHCCSQTQWKLPSELMPKSDADKELVKNTVSSNFSCNLGQNTGCVCIKKDEINYLTTRGGNLNC